MCGARALFVVAFDLVLLWFFLVSRSGLVLRRRF